MAVPAGCRRNGRRRWVVPAGLALVAALFLMLHTLMGLHSSSRGAPWDQEEELFGGPALIRRSDAWAGATTATDLEVLMRPVAKPGAAAAGTDAGTHQHTQPLIHRQAVATPARGSATELSAASAGASGGGAGGLTFVTFGNTAMWDFTHNWVLAVQLLRRPFVVGALDRGMSERCAAEGFPHVDLWREEATTAEPGSGPRLNSSFFRADFTTFRHMGATKVQLALSVLESNPELEAVVVSDADTVWLRDPSPYLAQHPTADWFISTDCLSAEVEEAWAPSHNQPRCGHIPGNIWGRAYNTGVFAVRNRAAGRDTLAAWRDFLLDPQRTTTTDDNITFGVTDQLALNMLLEEGTEWELHAVPGDARVTLNRRGAVRVHPLPVLLFASGHVAFVQRLPWRHGQQPYVVHATFQRYSTELASFGKRARFREFGLWHLDGPEYFAPPGASYLTYDNDVRAVVAAVAAQRYPASGMPALYKQIVGISFQLALFRDALAAARMLGRTLVLPTSWCWCDYDWTPHVLERCKIRGSDLTLPFECPADFVFNLPLMDMQGLDYRVPGFLDDPRAPPELQTSRAQLRVADGALHGESSGSGAGSSGGSSGGGGGGSGSGSAIALVRVQLAQRQGASGAALHLGATQQEPLHLGATRQELLDAAAPLADTKVIELRGMRPGLLRGWGQEEQDRAFDTMFWNITDQLYWCCASHGGTDTSVFWYHLPPGFNDGPSGTAPGASWQAPVMQVPPFCDDPGLSKDEKQVIAYANHPCQFLRNATAAAIAGALSTA